MTSRNRMTLIPATLLLTIMLPIGVLAQSNHMTLEQLFGMPPDEWREQQEAELKQIIEDVIQMNGEPHQSSAQQALQVYLSFTHPSSSVVNGRMDFIWYWLDPPRYASPWFRKASRCVAMREFFRTGDIHYVLDNLPHYGHPSESANHPRMEQEDDMWASWLSVAQQLKFDSAGSLIFDSASRLLFMDLTATNNSLFCTELFTSRSVRRVPVP